MDQERQKACLSNHESFRQNKCLGGLFIYGSIPTLRILGENMNSQLFISIMQGHLLRQAEVFHCTDWRVVMDNDLKHTSLLSRQWIEENIPYKMPWPSQGPDMNPIDNLFGWLKQKILKKGPR